ncbi:hypothetical protein DYU05_05945 [Mucilaginibacter terrenus]|uniref:Uncharacterized protein n=1 Tax=Mucilaginibacter terrenus TaxID=2482727 RepID=A0A3E2NW50_9SPHI|nr:hypothetical protein DYU05_05945 [Mucilaginibacter terrenus]
MKRLHEIMNIKSNLRNQGFDHTFVMERENIRCLEYGVVISPEEFEIIEIHYCNTLNNDDKCIIYGIELTSYGVKGVLISHYQCYLAGMSIQLWHKFAGILRTMFISGTCRPVNNHLKIVRFHNNPVQQLT